MNICSYGGLGGTNKCLLQQRHLQSRINKDLLLACNVFVINRRQVFLPQLCELCSFEQQDGKPKCHQVLLLLSAVKIVLSLGAAGEILLSTCVNNIQGCQ